MFPALDLGTLWPTSRLSRDCLSRNTSPPSLAYKRAMPCAKRQRNGREPCSSRVPPKCDSSCSSSDTGLLFCVAAAASAGCYVNALAGDLVHDDLSAIKTNGDVIGTQPLGRLFWNDFWGKPMADPTSHKSYRPLTILTFRLNVLIHGINAVFGFHLVNVLLHSAVTVLFAVLCRWKLSLGKKSTLVASLLFATHPVHTEAVAGVVGRADVLAGLLFLLSLLSYLRCLERVGDDTRSCVRQLLPSVLLATASMLAKEHGITVLGVNALWDLATSRHLVRRVMEEKRLDHLSSLLVKRLLILSATAMLLVAFRLLMLQGSMPNFCDQDNPASFSPFWITRFLTFAYLPAFNAWLLLWPSDLSYDWQLGSIPVVEEWRDIRNAASLAFYAALIALAVKTLSCEKEKDRRVLELGFLLSVIPFLPAANLFFRVGFVVAERILYIPSLGFCLVVGAGWNRLSRLSLFRWRLCSSVSLSHLFIAVLLIVFSTKTLRRNADWVSRDTLFTSGLKLLPHNAKMHYNYANLQKDLGNTEEAIFHYRNALRLWPTHASAHNNLGTLLNDSALAEMHFNQAIRINPLHAHAFFNLANLKLKEGHTSLALSLMERSVELDSSNTDAVTALATMYADAGETSRAEKLHQSLIENGSGNADHLNNYAAFLHKTGRLHEALSYYQKALRADSNHTVALVNAARLMRKLRLNEHAETLYQRALEKEADPQVKDGLGVLYLNTGRAMQAEQLFKEVLEDRPNDTLAKVHLAQAKFHQRRYSEAEVLVRAVTEQETPPPPQEVLPQLAALLSQLNRTHEAAALLARALHFHTDSNDRCAGACKPPADCAALYALHGDLANDLRDIDAAVQSYKKAVCIQSNLPHVHLNLGAIYHIKGEFTEAWKHYRQALAQDPTNEVLLQNIEKLRKAELQRAGSLACQTTKR